MTARIVEWCTRRSRLVVALAVVAALGGEWARRSLSGDAVPDLSDPQIGIVVDWMGHPATEVATRVTKVLTESLKSIPTATTVRGLSMAGMSYVDVVFGSSGDLDEGRQAIVGRVVNLRLQLPNNIRLQIGPRPPAPGGCSSTRSSIRRGSRRSRSGGRCRKSCSARRSRRSPAWPRWPPSARSPSS